MVLLAGFAQEPSLYVLGDLPAIRACLMSCIKVARLSKSRWVLSALVTYRMNSMDPNQLLQAQSSRSGEDLLFDLDEERHGHSQHSSMAAEPTTPSAQVSILLTRGQLGPITCAVLMMTHFDDDDDGGLWLPSYNVRELPLQQLSSETKVCSKLRMEVARTLLWVRSMQRQP